MRKGYLKSAHLDRRDHLLHILFYPSSDSSKGGDIQIMKLKKNPKNKINLIFFLQKKI